MGDPGPLVARTAALAGTIDVAAAEAVLVVVLGRLGAALDASRRSALADALPPTLRAAVEAQPVAAYGDLGLDGLGAATGVAPGHAVELALAALQALAEALPPATLALVAAGARSPWPPLLRRRAALEPVSPRPPLPPPPGEGRTLATGRPGSRHPVADFAVERAHAGSVVRAHEPRAGTTLSGGRTGGDPVDAPPPRRRRGLADAGG